MPLHLLFPLFSSIVFVIGMIYAKNAIARGSSPWTGTFLANFWLAIFWGSFALITGRFLPIAFWWQAEGIGSAQSPEDSPHYRPRAGSCDLHVTV